MANIFNSVFSRKVRSSNFSMSYDHKLTGNMGNLIPFHIQEALPGDRFNLGASVMVRFAPILAPIMHKVDVYCHFFFVPNRLLWPNWETFITQSKNGYSSGIEPAPPVFSVSAVETALGSLSDYLGVPQVTGPSIQISALPYAAYQRVYFDYYRDENLSVLSKDNITLVDGGNASKKTDLLALRRRAWQHDYFTGALPFAQKGNPVQIPVGQYSDVDVYLRDDTSSYQEYVKGAAGADPANTGEALFHLDVTAQNTNIGSGAPEERANLDPNGTLRARTSDLSENSTSITDLRNAFRLQEWLEKNARSGTRYVENLLAHWGVRSSDKRLDRAEYLGGTRQPLVVSEVLQTSSTDATSPQANMAGHGISFGSGKLRPYFCEEHGFVIGIMSVMPSTAYFQGLPKMFSRNDAFDYAWPAFQHIGEQAVLNQELYVNSAVPNGVFGYVPRFADYKYMPSRVSGQFESTLKYWHLAREFSSDPVLNNSFVECNPSNRVFAVTDDDVDHLYCHVFNDISVRRRLSKYSNPGF